MKSEIASVKPEELRPILHGQIDQLNADDLPLVHRVLLQLKAERSAEKITAGLESDRENVFDCIEETICEYRKKHPYQ
jgi:hypothetical protein